MGRSFPFPWTQPPNPGPGPGRPTIGGIDPNTGLPIHIEVGPSRPDFPGGTFIVDPETGEVIGAIIRDVPQPGDVIYVPGQGQKGNIRIIRGGGGPDIEIPSQNIPNPKKGETFPGQPMLPGEPPSPKFPGGVPPRTVRPGAPEGPPSTLPPKQIQGPYEPWKGPRSTTGGPKETPRGPSSLPGIIDGIRKGLIFDSIINAINQVSDRIGTIQCESARNQLIGVARDLPGGLRELKDKANQLHDAARQAQDGSPPCAAAIEDILDAIDELSSQLDYLIGAADYCASDLSTIYCDDSSRADLNGAANCVGNVAKKAQAAEDRLADLAAALAAALAGDCTPQALARSRVNRCRPGTVAVPYRTPSGQLVYRCRTRATAAITDP